MNQSQKEGGINRYTNMTIIKIIQMDTDYIKS